MLIRREQLASIYTLGTYNLQYVLGLNTRIPAIVLPGEFPRIL
jgi:hypothetical protein